MLKECSQILAISNDLQYDNDLHLFLFFAVYGSVACPDNAKILHMNELKSQYHWL